MADSAAPTLPTCPSCGEPLQAHAKVCRHCLHVVHRAAWQQQHDAGRLGADDRGGGQPIEDPPVGPIPLTGGGLGGALANGLRLVTVSLLGRRRR